MFQKWALHLFILLQDRLYYTGTAGNEPTPAQRRPLTVPVAGEGGGEPSASLTSERVSEGDEDLPDLDQTLPGMKPSEMHITEEWFHGRITR